MAGFDFNRDCRLLHKEEFDRVFAGPSTRLKRFPVRLIGAPIALPDGRTPRLGIVVAKRVLRRAVDRNRVRRVIRESFRLARRRLPGLDIVVLVFAAPMVGTSSSRAQSEKSKGHGAQTLDVQKLRKALDRLWGELSLEAKAS